MHLPRPGEHVALDARWMHVCAVCKAISVGVSTMCACTASAARACPRLTRKRQTIGPSEVLLAPELTAPSTTPPASPESRRQAAEPGARSVALTTLRGRHILVTARGDRARSRQAVIAGPRAEQGTASAPRVRTGEDICNDDLICLQAKALSWFCLLAECKGARARDARKDDRICEFRLFPLIFAREPHEQPM